MGCAPSVTAMGQLPGVVGVFQGKDRTGLECKKGAMVSWERNNVQLDGQIVEWGCRSVVGGYVFEGKGREGCM